MFYALILLATASRLLPHPPNVACIAAAGLFAGCYLRGYRALGVPMAAMLLSDVIGHVFRLPGMGFYQPLMMVAVYGAMASSVWVGTWLRGRLSLPRLVTASLATSTLFFLASNLGFWMCGFNTYDLAGFVNCYAAAIPFFQFTAVGDLMFAGVLFGAMQWEQIAGVVRRRTLSPVAL